MSARYRSNPPPSPARLINLRVIGGAVVVASLLLTTTLALLLATRQARTPTGVVTAALTLIPANTSTPQPATAGPGAVTAGTLTVVPSPQPGVISVGSYVQVVGTGGDGLRLRDQPGLAGQVLLLGSESEVFKVDQGPQEADGYTWWYLVGPFDPNRHGWAVANYLQVTQSQ